MIKVEKNFNNIPSILNSENRKEAFNQNIIQEKYCDKKNRYRVKSIQNRLKSIYHNKCAFCEKKLLDSPKHIEHYRPKRIYYWLAYSWDNLLLACGECNSAKGINFELNGNRVKYSNEPFDINIHKLSDKYNEVEKPKMVNPEIENIESFIEFDIYGNIKSSNERVQYTIDVCKLNRKELKDKRVPIFTDFINILNEHLKIYIEKGDISRFEPNIKSFIENIKKENEFYTYRKFIVENVDYLFDNRLLKTIMLNYMQRLKYV